jgi:hypothetical protein
MRLHRVLSAFVAPVTILSMTVPPASPASAAGRPVDVFTLAVFDHAAAETPENLVVLDRRVIVSLAFASTVVVLNPDGSRHQSVHLQTAGGFIAGLAVDVRRHALAISVSSPDADVAGLYEAGLLRDGRLGPPARLATLPAGAFPNGLTFDPHGTLYAADSSLGTIWRVGADVAPGAAAQAWVRSPLLEPEAAGLPGANGLKYRQGELFVSNTGRRTLLSIPLRGRATGRVSLVRDDLQIDDFAFDADGTLYAALNQANEVVRTSLDPAGSAIRVLAGPGDGVHNPSAVALAGGRVYLTNAAFDGPTPPPSVQVLGSHRAQSR